MRCWVSVLFITLLISPSLASSPLEFAQGFLLGLQKDPNSPDACASDSSTLLQDTESVVGFVEQMMAGQTSALTSLILAAKKLADDLKGFNGDCDFTGLLANLEGIATPEGFSKVIWTYLNNEQTFNSDWSTVQSCEENYTACGQAAGQMFSLISDWSI